MVSLVARKTGNAHLGENGRLASLVTGKKGNPLLGDKDGPTLEVEKNTQTSIGRQGKIGKSYSWKKHATLTYMRKGKVGKLCD